MSSIVLNDTSPMPYGEHKGKAMIDVPARYLLWLWENNKYSKAVGTYILNNLDALRKEAGQDAR